MTDHKTIEPWRVDRLLMLIEQSSKGERNETDKRAEVLAKALLEAQDHMAREGKYNRQLLRERGDLKGDRDRWQRIALKAGVVVTDNGCLVVPKMVDAKLYEDIKAELEDALYQAKMAWTARSQFLDERNIVFERNAALKADLAATQERRDHWQRELAAEKGRNRRDTELDIARERIRVLEEEVTTTKERRDHWQRELAAEKGRNRRDTMRTERDRARESRDIVIAERDLLSERLAKVRRALEG